MSISLGSVIYTAVKPIWKIYFIILCGFFFGKRNILTVETARNVSDIVVSLILPCLVFNKIVTNIENSDIKQIGIVVLVSIVLFGLGGLGALLVYYITKSPKYWKGGCVMVGLCPNISDLPIAYISTLASGLVFSEEEGDMGIAYICIFTAVQVFIQFNLGSFKLIGWDFTQQNKNQDLEQSTKSNSGTEDNEVDEDASSSSRSSFDPNQNQVIPLEDLERTMTTATNATSNLSLRRARSQSINDVINEYSQASRIFSGKSQPAPGEFTDLKAIPTTNASAESKRPVVVKFLLFFLDNFKRPLSVALVIAIIISMIPWVKALFVTTDQASLPTAPDKLPPLSFIMDFTGYLANACVPLGLLILGSTLARLKIGEMPKGFWQTPLALSVLRLIILPVIGVLINTRLHRIGWFDDDKILQFVCTIVFGLPNATSLIYLTAFYTPLEGDHKQMDYLALTYIIEYPLLAISLPFVTTYTVKVSLGF